MTQHDTETVEQQYVEPLWMARYWGVTAWTIYRDIRKGALPAKKLPGGKIRIAKRDALEYGKPMQ